MKNFVLGSGVVAALVFGCGKSSSSDEAPSQGGSGKGGAGAATAGGNADAGDDGGAAISGGSSSKGGSAARGGAAVQSGGTQNTGKGGAPAIAGSASGGDVAGGASGSSGGADEPAGAPSTGGAQGTGGASNTGGADACGDCAPLEQCYDGHLCVAKSIALDAGYSIDATEVTRAQYAAWTSTDPAIDDQRDECAWNASFTPDATCMSKASVCQGDTCARHPQPCVDFCDAAAYCEAIGKHLCGAVDGGAIDPDKATDVALSQWHHACTSGGANDFVYGDALVVGRCNDATSGGSTTVTVGARADCQSPDAAYAGVFDLTGNVMEWEDNCRGSEGQADICNPRGGAFGISAASPNCSQGVPLQRHEAGDTIGFRCCSG